MQFKSPTDTPIQVALLSGHCAVVGPEWRDLPPNLHPEAFRLGCISDNMSQTDIESRVIQHTPQATNAEKLAVIIHEMIAENKPANFTGAGLPHMKTLSAKAGWTVNREDMMQAMRIIEGESE